MNETDKRLALLVDAENISHNYIEKILNEVAIFGRPTYKKIYGDFITPDKMSKNKKPRLDGWNEVVKKEYTLTQMQQMSHTAGKNSSDSALIIDAMEILYSGNVEIICIVSSDSDFTGLAMKIAESGIEVIGMGENKTPQSLVTACSKFVYLDQDDTKKDEKEKPESTKLSDKNAKIKLKDVVATIKNAIENSDTDDKGWTNLGPVGSVLKRRFPEFDPRRYGAKSTSLSDFVKDLSSFEVDGRHGTNSNNIDYYIRVKK